MWYLQKSLKPMGPFSEEEVLKKIKSGDLRPFDLVQEAVSPDQPWAPAMKVFKRHLKDFPSFQEMPPLGAAWKEFEKHDWILLETSPDGVKIQKGPLSFSECISIAQKTTELVYCWKPGLTGWVPVVDRPEYQSEVMIEILS